MSQIKSIRQNQRLKITENNHGFSLVEIIIVLAIAGLLFIVVLAAYNQGQIVRRDDQRKEALHTVANNLDKFRQSRVYSNYYPWNNAGPVGPPSTFIAGRCNIASPAGVSCFRWYFDPAYSGSNTNSYADATLKDPYSRQIYLYQGFDDTHGTDDQANNLVSPTRSISATIYYRMGWVCGADATNASSFNPGVYRLSISLESGSIYCLDNH